MLRILLLPTLILLLLAGMGFYFSGGGRQGGAITIASNADTKTLDPGKMSWAMDIRMAMGMWEGLMNNDPKTLKPIPGVAEKWELSADGKTYTFHLRSTARWSNGDPVVAGDFVFAWERNLRPATAAPYLNMLLLIDGAQEYLDAVTKDAAAGVHVRGIRVVDDHTLVVTLANPCAYFLTLAAFPPLYPLHEKSMAAFLIKGNQKLGYDNRWTRPPYVVSNGAYQLTDWQFKRYEQLDPNPYYWDKGSVKNKRLFMVAYEDSRAGFLAQQSGAVDVMTWVPPEFGAELRDQVKAGQRNDVVFEPVFGTYYYIFNCTKPPLNDRRVRQALVLAVDKAAIVDKVMRLGQKPINTIVPAEGCPGYVGPRGLDMDVAKARQLLAEAGFPGGKNFPEMKILFNTAQNHGQIAQIISQMWQENLHIPVSCSGMETPTFGALRKSHEFMIARAGWYGDYQDPTTWLDLARTNDGDNDGRYSNPRYDALLEQAARELNPAVRMKLLGEAERILAEEDFPFLPLFQYTDGMVYDPKKIGGLDFNTRMMISLKNIYRK